MARIWALVFYISGALIALTWATTILRCRPELKRLSACTALLFTTVTCFTGAWGMLHLEELRRRSMLDWHFEERGWLLDTVGLIAALIWVSRSRNWCSWGTLAVAAFLQLAWLSIFSSW